MNHRVVVIVLVGLFTTCVVSTGAIGTLTVIKGIVNAASDGRTPREDKVPDTTAPEPEESTALPRVPKPPPDEDLSAADPTTASDDDLADEADDYAPSLLGTAEFAVFHLVKPKLDPWVALQKAAKGTKVKVFKNSAPASAIAPYLELRDLPCTDYAVISGPTLEKGRGLTPAVKAALPKAKRVSVLDASMPVGGTNLLDVEKVLYAYAQLTGGVMWDEETQEYFSTDAWKSRRLDTWEKGVPHASLNITVFTDAADKGLRTAGLKHFGLPEFKIANVPAAAEDSALALLQAAAQMAVEDVDPLAPGLYALSLDAMKHAGHKKALSELMFPNASRRVNLLLANSPTAKVPTLTVGFAGSGAATDRLQAGLVEFFGSEK